MKDKRVLVISSEVMPYMPDSDISLMSFETAKIAHKKSIQTRIFMPRFGVVNERRHQLHEVIRLSGVNLIIDDIDVPLVIKVASIPKERMQVYFIDNEDYFKRKFVYTDAKGKLFDDNDERAIFFTKGVINTVKKLNWAPDVIYLHGWFTSLIPLYLKEYYKDDALFKESKIVTSLYNDSFKGELSKSLSKKITFDNIEIEKLDLIKKSSFTNIQKLAVQHSDFIIFGSEDVSDEIKEFVKKSGKTTLEYQSKEDFEKPYTDFLLNKIM
ncbi:MAG TPA: glycogen synthase [Lutibacter sp.]|nr:glycogen synthase [Lutibacter sp.]